MENIESLLVFGSTGSCGRALVERSLSRGFHVTAYVRNFDKATRLLDSNLPTLEIVEGDISDEAQITALLQNHDAVVSCLSSFEKPHTGMSSLTKCLIEASKRLSRGNLRFIAYSLAGVDKDGDRASHAIQSALGFISPNKFGPAIADHKEVIRLLRSSDLNYTLFQTATMVNRPAGAAYFSGSPEECPGIRIWHRWGLLDAADVCLDALNEDDLPRLQMKYV